jgi:8-oxo-dGTP diphosphatase
LEPAKGRIYTMSKARAASKETKVKKILGARVIVIEKSKILLMHRHKKGKEYFVLPGGIIEPGETPEETMVREAMEETSLKISKYKLFAEVEDDYHHDHYYLAEEYSGEPKLGNGPEIERQSPENQYKLEWMPLKKLPSIVFYPEQMKKKIIFENFPEFS